MMIDMDAPEHFRRRRLVSEGFTPRRIKEGEASIGAICDQILDGCASGVTPTSYGISPLRCR